MNDNSVLPPVKFSSFKYEYIYLNSEYTYIVKKVHEFKPEVNVGSRDNYHLSLSHFTDRFQHVKTVVKVDCS